MTRPLASYEGYPASWGADGTGTVETETLLASIAPASVTIDVDGDTFDVTPLGASQNSRVFIPGRKVWTANISGTLVGYQGSTQLALATSGGEYVLYPTDYTLNITRGAAEATILGSSEWKRFIPLQYTVDGTFSCLVDNGGSGNLTLPPAFGASLNNLTLTYKTSHTAAFAAAVRSTGYSNPGNSLQVANFAYQGSGAITFAGATTPLFAAGALGAPFFDEGGDLTYRGISLVVNADSNTTLTGPAFWTGITVTGQQNGPTLVSITAQGTGPLVIA